jgi:hypothetical protein
VRYRHAWPGFLLLAALALLLVGLVRWGDHFLSPGPTGGINRLLQLWAASRPPDESAAASNVPTLSSRTPEAAAPGASSDPVGPTVQSTPAVTPATPAPPVPAPPVATPAPPASPQLGTTPAPPAPTPPVTPSASSAAAVPAPGPPPERAEPPRTATSASAPAPPGTSALAPVRYALALGTFAVSEDAERVEARLNQAGFSTVRFRQQVPAKLFAVHVTSLKDPEEGQTTVERLRREGYPQGVLLVGRSGVTVRVGPPVPLRTAVQLAEKLRASGYDAKVVTEPARAGQISLRHGNFASRDEAEAVSREVAGLGVPNEVVPIR